MYNIYIYIYLVRYIYTIIPNILVTMKYQFSHVSIADVSFSRRWSLRSCGAQEVGKAVDCGGAAWVKHKEIWKMIWDVWVQSVQKLWDTYLYIYTYINIYVWFLIFWLWKSVSFRDANAMKQWRTLSKRWQFWDASKSFSWSRILLMEEILHHLGCVKPCK